jgi:transaldolase
VASKDATTNPTLILQAAGKPAYQHLIDSAIEHGKKKGGSVHDQAAAAMDLLVRHLFSPTSVLGSPAYS